MSTYTQIIYHIVFGTKKRKPVLTASNRKRLFKYVWSVLKGHKCHLYRINGVEDHLHMVSYIHPTIALADLIKDMKVSSNDLIKRESLFPGFEGWQSGYGAFTHSAKDKDRLIEYVKNQEAHHRKVTFREEFKALLKEHDIEFKEKYLL